MTGEQRAFHELRAEQEEDLARAAASPRAAQAHLLLASLHSRRAGRPTVVRPMPLAWIGGE